MKNKTKITYEVELNYNELIEIHSALEKAINQDLDGESNETLINMLDKCYEGILKISNANNGLNKGE